MPLMPDGSGGTGSVRPERRDSQDTIRSIHENTLGGNTSAPGGGDEQSQARGGHPALTYTNDVAGVQRALRHRGYDPGSVDGVFGPETEQAVRRFQRDRGLTEDGVVGPQTGSALMGSAYEGGTWRRGSTRGTRAPSSGSGGSGGGGGGAGPGAGMSGGNNVTRHPDEPGPDASDAEIEEFVRREYGYLAWLLENDELSGVLYQAVREGRDESWVESQIMATDWWQETAPHRREWEMLQGEDPAQADHLREQVGLDIRLMASQLGVPMSDQRIGELADHAISSGWVNLGSGQVQDQMLQRAVVAEFDYNPSRPAEGDMGALQDSVMQRADEWMVPMGERAAMDWTRKILNGEATEDGLNTYLHDMAVSRFPHLEGHLEAGMSPSQFFEPYRQTIAEWLEMDPSAIDLEDDPRWSPVIDFVEGEDGEPRPMRMSELQRHVRGQEEWRQTRRAQQRSSEVAEGIGQMFGEVGS